MFFLKNHARARAHTLAPFTLVLCSALAGTLSAMDYTLVFNPTHIQAIQSPDTKWDFRTVQFSPIDNDLLAAEVNAKVVLLKRHQMLGWGITNIIKNQTTRTIFDLAFSRDGTTLVAPFWGGAEILKKEPDQPWHWAEKCLDRVVGAWDVNCARFNHRGNLLAYGTGYGGILLSPYTKTGIDQKQLWSYTCKSCKDGHEPYGIPSIAFSPDDTTLGSSCKDSTVKLWEQKNKKSNASWQCTKTLKMDDDSGYPLAFLNNALLVTSNATGTMQVHNKKDDDWKLIQTLAAHKSYITGLVVPCAIPGGPDLISGSWDTTLKFWQLAQNTLKCIKTVLLNHVIWGISVSPDGTILAATLSNKTLELWSLFSHNEKKRGRNE